MKLTETLKRRIDAFFRNLTDEEKEYLIEKYFNNDEKSIEYNVFCEECNVNLKKSDGFCPKYLDCKKLK